jgi:hypothetical protein
MTGAQQRKRLPEAEDTGTDNSYCGIAHGVELVSLFRLL